MGDAPANGTSCAEIDLALASCPGVKASRTVGVPQDASGELVVALVARVEEQAPTSEAVLAFLKERLAGGALPGKVIFVDEAELAAADLTELARRKLTAEVGWVFARRLFT